MRHDWFNGRMLISCPLRCEFKSFKWVCADLASHWQEISNQYESSVIIKNHFTFNGSEQLPCLHLSHLPSYTELCFCHHTPSPWGTGCRSWDRVRRHRQTVHLEHLKRLMWFDGAQVRIKSRCSTWSPPKGSFLPLSCLTI